MRVEILRRLLKKRWFLCSLGVVVLFICLGCGSTIWFFAKPAETPNATEAASAGDYNATPAPTTGWPALDSPSTGWDLDFSPSATATPLSELGGAEGPAHEGRWVRVSWNGTGGANCHLSLEPTTWNTNIVRVPVGTELKVIDESQATIVWESEYTVWQVEYQNQQCYIRTQLAEELPLTTRP